MPRHSHAYTLLEVVIAFALFLAAIGVVMEAIVATRHLSSLGAAKDQVEIDANGIIRVMAADLALSGWELGDGGTNFAGVAPATDRGLRYYPMVQVQRSPDGTNTAGFNTTLPWTRLSPEVLEVRKLPAILPGAETDDLVSPLPNWDASFHARSTQLVFLRSTIGSWRADVDPGSAGDESIYRNLTEAEYVAIPPERVQLPVLDFTRDSNGLETGWQDWRTASQHARLGVLFTSGFYESVPGTWTQRFPDQPYGVTMDAGWYDWTDLETAPIKPSWESMRKPNTAGLPAITGMTASEVIRAYTIAPERLREYMYAVVPSPTALGMGRLVRAYRRVDAAAFPVGVEPGNRITDVANDAGLIATEQVAMVIDKVLSDDVVRVVFDTYRTVDAGSAQVTTLGINQVRVRLYLARRQVTNPDVVVRRLVETTLSMRARSSGGDMDRISGTLGTTPIGLVR